MKRTTASLSQGVYYEHLETINGVRFTPREIDIIACLLSGKASKAIAAFLSIEEKTVEAHKYNVMRKLECNSKESIITFIERCDKFPLVRKHYLGLLVQKEFEKHLREISLLTRKDVTSCSIIYWKEEGNKPSFIHGLETYLRLAGVKLSVELREGYKSLIHLIHKIEPGSVDYILYVPPLSLIEDLHTGDGKGESELFPFIQKHSQDPGSVIFLLTEVETLKNLPQTIQNIGYIDFTMQENYYFSLLNILERILPGTSLEKIIAEFRKQHGAIYGPSGKPFPQLWPEEREKGRGEEREREGERQREREKEREKRRENRDLGEGKVSHEILKHKRNLLVGGICIFLCTLHFLPPFRENKAPSTSHSGKVLVSASVRSELPIPHDNVLLERPDLISELDAQFKKGSEDIKALALAGIGGSGKTVIARQYARRRLADGVVWEANAETRRSLKESFENFAYLLAATEEEKRILMGLKDIRDPEEKEEKIILFVKERLKTNPGWLLIFDNVEKFSDIRRYFPSDSAVWGKGKVIITTQNSNMETHSAVHRTVSVKELTFKEKLTLFVKILSSGDPPVTPIEKEKAKTFLNALPSLPLDISIAAYYLKATNISYEEYIKNISSYKSGFNSVQSNILNEVGGYSKTRYKIITMSLEKMMKESKDFGETLLLISLIDSHNIPKELLGKFKDPFVADNFIHHLKKYSFATTSLVSENPSIPCVTIHRSIQNAALAYLIKELDLDKDSSLLKKISHALDSYIDKALEEEDFLRMKISASHAEIFVKHTDVLPDLIAGLIKSKLGCLYYFLNDEPKAQKTIEASLPILEAQLTKEMEEDHIEVAQAFLHLGNVYTELNNCEKAKNLLEKSLRIYHKAPSKDYLKISWGLSHLANAYRRSGYYSKAKDLLEESLVLQNQYSQNHGRIARTLAYLGSVHRGLGQYEKAVEILEQSLKLYKQHFPKDHFRVGWVLCHLGNICRKLGDYKKSIEILEESLKIYRKHFSEKHISVGLMLTYLGNSYKGLGNYEKAKEFLEEGLRIHEKRFKTGHERLGRILFHLGNVYKELKDYEKSGASFKKALAIYENSYNKKGEIEMARLFRNMGDIHLLENRLEDAEEMIHKSLEILKRHKHPEVYVSLESLAGLFLKKSQEAAKGGNNTQAHHFKEQALNQLSQALHIMEEHFPEGSNPVQKIHSKIKKIKEGNSF